MAETFALLPFLSIFISNSDKNSRNVEYSTYEEGCLGCRIFDIRRTANRMSKIRHPKKGVSDVEYSTEANIGSKIESNLFAHL